MPRNQQTQFVYEIIIALGLAGILSFLFITFDALDWWYEFTRAHEDWELDELAGIFIAILLSAAYLLLRFSFIFTKQPALPSGKKTMVSDESAQRQGAFLTAIYVSALALIAFLMLLASFITHRAIERQIHDSTIINISGRQRMLSQRTALLTAKLVYPAERQAAKDHLRTAIDQMKRAHFGLTRGDLEMGLPDERSDIIRDMYFKETITYEENGQTELISLDEFVKDYLEELDEVLELKDHEMTLDHPLMHHVINDYHNTLLPLLHKIVNQYEKESRAKVRTQQNIEYFIVSAIILILLLEGAFIFRPMVRNIQEKTAALIEVNKELEQQRHKDKFSALGEMASGLAHEINNALQPVLGLSGIARRRLEGKDQQLEDFMETIENSALHAKDIVQSVLEFSSNERDLNYVYADAQTAFGESIGFARSFLPTSVQVKLSETKPLEKLNASIYYKKTQLIQILINIFKNAIYAMEENGTITVSFEQRRLSQNEKETLELSGDEYVTVTISDEGSGMDEHTLENIFNPFFTTKEEGKGTGLGLSTVYGIMKQHSGAVAAKSEPGKGASFTLFFPVTHDKTA